jgi:hypothetical protein
MRKLLGKLGGAIPGPFLRSASLILLISPAICHAVDCDLPGFENQASITSVTPSTWYAGQTVNVSVVGYFPANTAPVAEQYCEYGNVDVTTPLGESDSYVGGPGYGVCDEYVFCVFSTAAGLISSITPVNASQTNFTIALPANTPSGIGYVVVSAEGVPDSWDPFPVQICAAPTITSIKPSTWFAGKTYNNVVIKGTGFITADKATAECPETQVSIAAADGSTVPVSGVTVVDKTKITATVAPPTDDSTETATVTVGAAPNTATATAQILGNQILCDPSMNCTQTVISTTDGSEPPVQNVVVGQPIILTSPPLPNGITATRTTWTVGGTNIGGYAPTPTSAPPPTKTAVTNSYLNTFWVYPQDGIPVTYQYCVNIPGVGNQCSLVANASFNVTGPTATITPNSNYWTVSPPISCPTTVQILYFGYPDPTSGCALTPLVKGISFQAALSSVPDSGGTAEWVQLITKNTLSGTLLSGGDAGPTSQGVGLDNSYPYLPDDPNDAVTTQASDSPNNALDPSLARETRRFKADMYYLWQPQISGSIFVPLGYVEWSTSGTAVQHTNDTTPWSLASSGATTAVFHLSTDTGNTHGYPTWSGIVTNGQSNGNENDDEGENLEEQQ